MSGCKFPEHHKSGSKGSGWTVVLGLVFAAIIWHKIQQTLRDFAVVAVHVVVVVVLVLAVAVVAAAVARVVHGSRSVHRDRIARPQRAREAGHSRWRHLPAAVWARVTFRWLSRNLGSAPADRHRGGKKVMRPRAVIYPSRFGVVARVRTVPGVGRQEFEEDAEHLANAWRCHRVAVSQPKPGRLVLHGYRADPLAAPLDAAALPAFDGRHLTLGRDEFGTMRRVSLANHSGSAWSGNPGTGKSECALALACQLAPSPLVETYIADGGSLDWAPFASGAAGYATDLEGVADMLHELAAGMDQRRRTLEADLGVRNAWHVGPTPEYPLRWVLLEECPVFLDASMVRGDKKREALVSACQGLVTGLLRRGRAPLYHVSLICQKATSDSLPTGIRDLAGVRWSFGVATLQAASAILGAEISQHPTLSPVALQDRPGLASALLPTGTSPYTLLRFPAVGEQRADQVAATLAARRPADNTPELVPEPV